LVIEAANEKELTRVRNFMIGNLKASPRHLREGAVAIVLYNADGEVIGGDITGSPSEEMRGITDRLFEGDE
jgi:hypothetical protein